MNKKAKQLIAVILAVFLGAAVFAGAFTGSLSSASAEEITGVTLSGSEDDTDDTFFEENTDAEDVSDGESEEPSDEVTEGTTTEVPEDTTSADQPGQEDDTTADDPTTDQTPEDTTEAVTPEATEGTTAAEDTSEQAKEETTAGEETTTAEEETVKPLEEETVFKEDGNYEVKVSLWDADKDKAHSWNVIFKNNPKALVRVEDDAVTKIQIATNPGKVDKIESALVQMRVDGKKIKAEKTGLFTTSPADKDYEYISLGSLVSIPKDTQPESLSDVTYLPVEIYIPDTKAESSEEVTTSENEEETTTSSGTSDSKEKEPEYTKARLKFEWKTAKDPVKDTTLKPNADFASDDDSAILSAVPARISLTENGSVALAAKVMNASGYTITYKSQDTKIADTDSDKGAEVKVTGKKKGETTILITASKKNEKDLTRSVKVEVTAKDPSTDPTLTVDPDEVEVTAGETASVKVTLKNADGYELEYHSANEKIATFTKTDSGIEITGVAEGTTTITASATKSGSDDLMQEIKVTVTKAPEKEFVDKETGITVKDPNNYLPEGATLVVNEITSGTEYETVKAKSYVAGCPFFLYDVYFVDADGKNVELPDGNSVIIQFPIPKGWGETANDTWILRFADNGSVLKCNWEKADTMYQISNSHFGNYALVNKSAQEETTTSQEDTTGGETTTSESEGNEFTDPASGIVVQDPSGFLPSDAKLVVVRLTSGPEFEKANNNSYLRGRNFVLYDIHFEDSQGTKIQPTGRVTVSMPIPSGLTSSNLVVIHFKDDGTASMITGVVNGDRYQFGTSSFSSFAFYNRTTSPTTNTTTRYQSQTTRNSTTNKTSAKTGDETNIAVWIIILVAAAATIAVVLVVRKRRQNS